MKRLSRSLAAAVVFSLAACGGKGPTGPNPAGPSAADLAKRLPDSAFKVEWTPPAVPSTLTPGQPLKVSVGVKNVGDTVWPDRKTADPDKAGGAWAVRLSYRFKTPGGEALTGYESRAEIPRSLAPGESAALAIELKAPPSSGDYVLQFDLVQEFYAWFADKKATKLLIPVKVG